MIEKVKVAIYRHEGKRDNEQSSFYDVVHKILVDRWNKSNTPLQCLTYSLNSRYYFTLCYDYILQRGYLIDRLYYFTLWLIHIIYVNRYYHETWLNENITRQPPH